MPIGKTDNPFDGWTIEQWTTQTLARDASRSICNPEAPEAVQWCALGWLDRSGWFDRARAKWEPMMEAFFAWCEEKHGHVTYLNDVVGWTPKHWRSAFEMWLDEPITVTVKGRT